jgi:hypothetical protein
MLVAPLGPTGELLAKIDSAGRNQSNLKLPSKCSIQLETRVPPQSTTVNPFLLKVSKR